MLVLLGAILIGAATWAIVRAVRTTRPVWQDTHDGAWCLVVLASSWLPEDPVGWGAAMRAEFGFVEGRGARRRFAFGCLRAALVPTRRTQSSGPLVKGGVVTALAACVALEVYGRVHYPKESAGGTIDIALFAVFLAVCAWMASGRNQDTWAEARRVRHCGVVGGVGVGALFVVSVTPLSHAGYAAILGVVCAIVVATVAASASRDPRAGIRAGLWVGVISGLVFFIGLMTLTYAAAGWFTRDAEAVAVFNNFRSVTEHGHQLQQWPGFAAFLVRRESAVALLFGFLGAPLIAIASGVVGGAIGGRRRRGSGPTTEPA